MAQRFRPIRSKATAYPYARITPFVMLHDIVRNWTADLAELEKALPKIRDYPTLLIWGTRDRAVDFQSAEPLRRNFRDAAWWRLTASATCPTKRRPKTSTVRSSISSPRRRAI